MLSSIDIASLDIDICLSRSHIIFICSTSNMAPLQRTMSYKSKTSSFRLGGLVSRLSVRKNNNDISVAPKAATSNAPPTRSRAGTDSTGRGSSSNSSVGSNEREQQKIAQADMIQYFEGSNDSNSMDGNSDRQKTGPVDLDLLDDNFHYYDQDRLDAFLESTVDTGSQDESSPNQEEEENEEEKAPHVSDQTEDENSEKTAPVDNNCKVAKIQFSSDEATIIGMPRKSRPVDMDAILDLEAQFDAILDEHEDNFQVWEASRQSINAIRIAEERAKRSGSKYGQSLRRQQDRKKWTS